MRRIDEDGRARVRAVLNQPGSERLTHERVAELAGVTENMARTVRHERGEVAGRRSRKPRAPRAPAPSVEPAGLGWLDPDQADLLARICDVALGDGAMGGISTKRLLAIRGLLKTRVGQRLRETAEAARRSA